MSATPRRCPLCEADAFRRLDAYSPAEWDLGRCGDCGFVYLRNPPPYQALADEFAWEKTYADKKERGGSTRASGPIRRLRMALGLIGGAKRKAYFVRMFPKGRVLDIGCGDRIRTLPPVVPFGIELSDVLHQRADRAMRERGGRCLKTAGAEGIWTFDERFFDGVIMHSYLEHETEPLAVLRGIRRALAPDGKAFVRVPNYGSLNRRAIGKRWCGFRHPDHVNYFTRVTLAAMAKKAGLGFKLLNRANLWLDDNIQALLLPV